LIFVPAATTNNNIQIAPNWSIGFHKIFEISILGLADDITNSVYKDEGYLQMLEKDNILQTHFEESIESIHAILNITSKDGGTLKC
jgi:hypothetical protein